MTKFIKMNGNGNDFVIIDSRIQEFRMSPKLASWIAYRRFGIGCDQVIVLEESEEADVFMRIFNVDGSESGACGNATRCVADLLMVDGKDTATVETIAGILEATRVGVEEVSVNMGPPSLEWQDIPLSEEQDCMELPIEMGELSSPTAVSMGNPHMVFFVPEVKPINIAQYAALEKHPMFPERANVSVAEVKSREHIVMKTWERGVGKTLSCGTAACATLVAAVCHDLVETKATIEQPGGKLTIEWLEDGDVIMTGKVSRTFYGEFNWNLEFQKD